MTVHTVFVFDGGDLAVFPTVAAAEGGTEVYDIDRFSYFTDDGTVLSAVADKYQVRLTATAERRPDELRDRLRAYLQHPLVGLDPGLAEDPVSAAQAILDREWSTRTFRWFPWLDRRLNGSGPARLVGPTET